jgi:hypothetical protein
MSARGLSTTRWREPLSLRDVGVWALYAWIVVGWLLIVPLGLYLRGPALLHSLIGA